MKSATFLKMTAVAGLCLFAGLANANTQSISWTQNPPGTWSDLSVSDTVKGNFQDIFTFSNPAAPLAGTSGANVFSTITGNHVVFTTFAVLDTLSNYIWTGSITSTNGVSQASLNFSLPGNTDPYNLEVYGYTTPTGTTAGYGGTFTVTAVPEPKTYAMLLAGLGLLVFMARRRNGNTGASFS